MDRITPALAAQINGGVLIAQDVEITIETLNAVKVAGQSGSAVRRSLAYSIFSGAAMS
jgi:hypothetical protein